MKHTLPFFVLSLLAITGCAHSTANAPSTSELPVSRVVMYQSGIGYVERAAVFEGDELVLRIRPNQINDILKSLTVIDRGNGRPVSISLPVSQKTLDAIAQIPANIQEGGIQALLEAFRGAHVKIKSRSGSYTGRIIGLEKHEEQESIHVNTNSNVFDGNQTTLTIMNENNVLEIIPVNDIKSVELRDKTLAEGLERSLNVSLNEGDWKQIELRIHMDSDKKRELAMSYIVSMPTWKPAYRLILSDSDQAVLQGWAVISNVTGSDWNDISFSLVSGQPMSFTYDLYTPQFLERPDLSGLAAQKANAPKIVESGYRDAKRKSAPKSSRSMNGMAMQAAPMAAAKGINMMADMAVADEDYEMEMPEEEAYFEAVTTTESAISADEMVSSFNELATSNQIGAFDEYKLASKLTVPEGNTALVNLIQKKFPGKETRFFQVSGYPANQFEFTKDWRMNSSYQTIEFRNDSDVALDAGPITLYRDGAVIGEGYLSRTEKDAVAYITFATETRLNVSVSDVDARSEKRLSHFDKGRCEFYIDKYVTTTFAFTSHIPNDVSATLQLEKPQSREPVNLPENAVDSGKVWNFQVDVPANGTASLPLTMKNSVKRTQNRSANCKEAIKNAIENNEISNPDGFKQYAELLDRLDEISLRMRQLSDQRVALQQDQAELSSTLLSLKNIKSGADSLRSQLMNRQKENDKKLGEITTELYSAQVEQSEIEFKLKSMENELSF